MSVPRELRNLRACKVCCLIKTLDQFEYEGCDNCDSFLHMKSNRDQVHECTSANFDGMIAMMDPKDSWVAKWQRIERCSAGLYAISVSGDLPPAIIRHMRDKNVEYRTRDMVLIEGIGDDVIFLFIIFCLCLTLVISWFSTHVRELPSPTHLLLVERIARSQRNNNGELVRPQTSDELELVQDAVEQALVDELLDDTLMTHNELMSRHEQVINSSSSLLAATSSSSSAAASHISSSTTNSTTQSEDDDEEDNNNDGADSNELSSDITTLADSLRRQLLVDSSSGAAVQDDATVQTKISIFIRFVNERVLKIQVKPSDTILTIKKNHFSEELTQNKIVRFIYQGQFLKDTNTINSYNIRDQTTIHCHITAGPPPSSTSTSNSTTSVPTTTTAVQRQQTPTSSTTAPTTTTSPRTTSISSSSSATRNRVNSLINVEFGTLLLPLFTVLLASTWYFRMNFKQFFSPLSNLFLFFITIVYTLFLFVHFYQMFTFAHRLTTTPTAPTNVPRTNVTNVTTVRT